MYPQMDEYASTPVAASVAELKAYGQQVAARFSVPWPIFNALITVESGWSTSPNEVSPTGAQGIAQIEPGTASSWNVDPWNPYDALSAAAEHLSMFYTQFGNNWSNALAAYNGGGSPQGMSAAYAGGYPQKVMAIAQSLGLGPPGNAQGGPSGTPSLPTIGGTVSSASPIGGSPTSSPDPVNFTAATLYLIVAAAVILAIVGIAAS